MEDHRLDSTFPIVALLRKHVQRVPLTPQEQALLHDWLAQDSHNRELFTHLNDEEALAGALVRLQQTDTAAQLKILNRRLAHKQRIRYIRRWGSIAAMLVLTLGISFWVYERYQAANGKSQIQLTSEYGDDVMPGTNRATLTLADGSVIQLSEDKSGIITGAGVLTYDDGSLLDDATTSAIEYATLTTPRGGQYRITLPDGSKVWLNAASSLKYPTAFTGNERKVEITGEGYFEIVQNEKQPFIVQSGQHRVQVLGTQFNVNAYPDQPSTVTTLVSGSVSISSNGMGETKRLNPGEQSIYIGNNITVSKVNIHSFTGWKEGEFVFHHITLAEILPQLERWYDLELEAGDIPDERFYAEINRSAPLSEVLSVIEALIDVKFEIRGRRLTIQR